MGAFNNQEEDMTTKTLTPGVAASAFLGGVAAIVLGLVWSAAWSGYTLSVLWGWFMVPAFGLPALSVAQAYGVALVVRVAHGLKDAESKDRDGFGVALVKLLVLPPFVAGLFLLFGGVAKA